MLHGLARHRQRSRDRRGKHLHAEQRSRRNRHRCAQRREARTLRKADRLNIGGREGHGGGRKESGAKGDHCHERLPVQARSGDRPRQEIHR